MEIQDDVGLFILNVGENGVRDLLGIIAVTALIWNLPITCFGIEGLTVIQQRVIAIFVFATLSWLFEAIPSWATSSTLYFLQST